MSRPPPPSSSSSSEANEELQALEELRDRIFYQPKGDRKQASAWEDDNQSVDSINLKDFAVGSIEDTIPKAVLDAAENGDLVQLKKYFSLDPSLIGCTDNDGYTPLHRACYGNHTEAVEYLLEMGAKIDAQTQDGWQPLHSACCWNHVETAAILIAHGADVNAKSKGNQTPLHLVSASSHHSQCLQLLLLHPDTDTQAINSSGDTAFDIAKRTDKYYRLFEIADLYLNQI